MNLIKSTTAIMLFSLVFTQANCQNNNEFKKDIKKVSESDYKYFIRSPYLTFTNGTGVENIHMYEFHFGYRIDSKNIIGVKAARWKIFEPMGIQLWDPNLLKESEWFTGRIKEYGIGTFYQRMLWKGLYTSVEVMPMLKIFVDENNQKIENGFRLYTSYHIGYHIPLFKKRVFIEPQIHFNYWPINSKGPEGFREQMAKYGNYFLFEPNLYIGVNF